MFVGNSLVKRIGIGKAVGFVVGLIGFIALPIFMPDAPLMLRWGILLWYPTMGAFIGAFGMFSQHPILKFPLHWWFRGPVIGGWMNFILILFSYDTMQEFLVSAFGENGAVNSPFWFVLEGILIGALIGYFTTRFGGEGEDLPVSDPAI